MADNKINVGGRLHSIATGNVLAGANEIFDDSKNKKQSDINTETYSLVNDVNERLSGLSPDQQSALNVAAKATNNETKLSYYVCGTDGNVAAKVISDATGYILSKGGSIKIKMTNANTANNATLNINSTGAKALYYDGERASANNSWEAGETIEVYYDGTSYYANNVAGGSSTGVFDVSKKFPTSGVEGGNTYTLELALIVLNTNLSANKKEGGMQIRFISSSDNKYVQARLKLSSFNAAAFVNPTNWEQLEDEPAGGSENIVKSGGIVKAISEATLPVAVKLAEGSYDSTFPYIFVQIESGKIYIVSLTSESDCSYQLEVTQNTTFVQVLGKFNNSQTVMFTARTNGNYIRVRNMSSDALTDKSVSVFEVKPVAKVLYSKTELLNESHTFEGVSAVNYDGLHKGVPYKITLQSDSSFEVTLNYFNSSGHWVELAVLSNDNTSADFILPNDLNPNGRINLYHSGESTDTINVSIETKSVLDNINNIYETLNNSIADINRDIISITSDITNINSDINTDIKPSIYGAKFIDESHTFEGVSAVMYEGLHKFMLYRVTLNSENAFEVTLNYFNSSGHWVGLGTISNINNSLEFRLPENLNNNGRINLYHGADITETIDISIENLGVVSDINTLNNDVYNKLIINESNTFTGVSAKNYDGCKKYIPYRITLQSESNFEINLNYFDVNNRYVQIGILSNDNNVIEFKLQDDLNANGRINLYHAASTNDTVKILIEELGVLSVIENINNDISKINNDISDISDDISDINDELNDEELVNESHNFVGVSGVNYEGYSKNVYYHIDLQSENTFEITLNYYNSSNSYVPITVLSNNNNSIDFILPEDLNANGRINLHHIYDATDTIAVNIKKVGIKSAISYIRESVSNINDEELFGQLDIFSGVSAKNYDGNQKNVVYRITLQSQNDFSLNLSYFNSSNRYVGLTTLTNENNTFEFTLPEDLNANGRITLYHGDSATIVVKTIIEKLGFEADIDYLHKKVSDIDNDVSNLKVTKTIISVKKDGSGDFTTIQDAVNSISDNSASHRYEIQIYDDFDYTEADINSGGRVVFATKAYVDFRGMNGIRRLNYVDSVGDANHQIIYWNGWVNLYNLHFRCENARYAIHIESALCANSEMVMDNCILEYAKCNMPNWVRSADALGCGAYNNQRVICKNSRFYAVGSAFAVHSNTSPQPLPFSYSFENCIFSGNCYDLRIGEFGQNNDMLSFTNCKFINNTAHIDITYGKTNTWDKLIPYMILPSSMQMNCGVEYIYALVAANGARIVGGTAYNDVVGSDIKIGNSWVGNIIIKDYMADIPNYNVGHLGNYHFALGNRLGDCSVTNKTLIIDINGTEHTITFNQNYSDGENVAPLVSGDDIISYINTELGGTYISDSISVGDVVEAICQ